MSWVLYTQMIFNISLNESVSVIYIPRWYFMSPSLNELLSVTYPDDISCLPLSMSCWVLHTQTIFHLSLCQWVVECYTPRWYFMSPSLNKLLSVTYPDAISCLPPILSCWVLHTQKIFHVSLCQWVVECYIPSLPQWVDKCYIPRWNYMSPSLS